MKRITLSLMALLLLAVTGSTFAQEKEKPEFDFGADLMSRYVWRGTMFGGTSPSLQPAAALTYKGFELGAWGAYSIGGSSPFQEMDLYLGYTFYKEMFTVTVTDYFFPTEFGAYDYYEFDKDSTGHIVEAMVSFNGTEKIPFSLTFAMNLWGADAERVCSDVNSADFNNKEGIQHSSYLELGYSREMKNDVTLDAFVGVNLTSHKNSDPTTGYLGESGFYGTKRGLVNIGLTLTKEKKINENFSLPLSCSLITNPMDKKIYFVFGVSI
jgi:hypothetical protein